MVYMEIGSDPSPNTNNLPRVSGARFREEGSEGKGRGVRRYAYLVALRRLRGRRPSTDGAARQEEGDERERASKAREGTAIRDEEESGRGLVRSADWPQAHSPWACLLALDV